MLGFATFLASVQASGSGAAWDYHLNGADWKDIEGYEHCGSTNQSPINLETHGHYKVF
jgi:hypothetical protein